MKRPALHLTLIAALTLLAIPHGFAQDAVPTEDDIAMGNAFLESTVLPSVGIGLLILAVVMLFLPWAEALKQSKQSFKGLGIELEVSILTLVILISVALAGSGLYFRVQDFEGRFEGLRENFDQDEKDLRNDLKKVADQLDEAKQSLRQAKFLRIDLELKLEGLGPAKPDFANFTCEYHLPSSPPVNCTNDLGTGVAPGSLKLKIEELARSASISQIVIKERQGNRSWELMRPLAPFQPPVELRLAGGVQ